MPVRHVSKSFYFDRKQIAIWLSANRPMDALINKPLDLIETVSLGNMKLYREEKSAAILFGNQETPISKILERRPVILYGIFLSPVNGSVIFMPPTVLVCLYNGSGYICNARWDGATRVDIYLTKTNGNVNATATIHFFNFTNE